MNFGDTPKGAGTTKTQSRRRKKNSMPIFGFHLISATPGTQNSEILGQSIRMSRPVWLLSSWHWNGSGPRLYRSRDSILYSTPNCHLPAPNFHAPEPER